MDASSNEEWRDIEGYEGMYQVSSKSRVRSLDRRVPDSIRGYRNVKGRILKTHFRGGREFIRLKKDGVQHPALVHRLVAKAFIPNPENLPVVRHLNDVPDDNRLENLAWGTYSDNMADCIENNGHYQKNQTHCKYGHEFTHENTYRAPGNPNIRICRSCTRRRKVEWRKARWAPRGSA